jgi:ketosteroid isomerase-like protein
MTAWIEEYLGAWGGTDVEKVMDWMTDDIDFEDVTMGHRNVGKGRVRRFVAACFEQVPDARFEVVGSSLHDDGYWVEWIMQPMGVRGASVGRLRDGKIAYNRDYWNGAAFQP